MKILIPQSKERNVVAAVRSLGRAGHDVTLGVKSTQPDPFLTRWARGKVVIPSPYISPEAYVDALEDVLQREKFDVLLPFSHAAVLPVSYAYERLARWTAIPFPNYAVLRRAHDKLESMRLAQQVGVPIPATFWPEDEQALAKSLGEIPYPCLVKARQGCGIGTTIRFARTPKELLAGYQAVSAQVSNPPVNDFSRPMIQEYIPGTLYDALFLYNHGQRRAAVAQVREVTYPLSGGTGARNRTIEAPELLELGGRLLDALGWHGPAQVEFMRDERDGQFKLMEINPKFWGTLACSLRAGVDFAALACEMAVQGDVAPHFDYTRDLTYRWILPDLWFAYWGAPRGTRWREVVGKGGPQVWDDMDWGDPMPNVDRLAYTIKTMGLHRERVLPAHFELRTQALTRLPAVPAVLPPVQD
ncbi:carboxylate--amine ligase [Levilinea saccharolytica]|uniref:Predicted ATP-grasp enzyme n=1 Tax=Levilinea saccharolytica TaxID=229921 RepID=A0A0N0RD53_9CHLR|nr:ATP-grasp domain-containing protein [Levilinea saccharolytica]KPL80751.1 hypothetical protein ADN01_11565 [Levilinea saccharolytica]GAP19573.1 predicted ATP-grasp enzyme [Levilinea saccharolytica]